MKKWIFTVFIGLCLIFFTQVQSQAADTFKIGVVYPLSGAMALPCKSILTGHKIAADEIMKAGGFQGKKVEFLVRDDAGNPELTTRYCRELITREKVDWIFTGYGSAVALAGAAVAKQFKTPTFIFGGKTEKVTTEEWNKYTFRYQVTSTAEARAAADILGNVMLKDKKGARIFWIAWDYEYSRSFYDPFVERLKKIRPDIKIVGESWTRTGETDYGPFISYALTTKPDAVISTIWGGGCVSLLKQGQSQGLWDQAMLINTAEPASIEYRKAFGKSMPVGGWGNTYDDSCWPQNEGQKNFYKAWYDFTGENEPPSGMASSGYYITYMVANAIEKAGTDETMAVIKALEGMSIDTYWGRFTIRDFDHQVTSGQIWAPMIEEPGLDYLVLDKSKLVYVPCDKDLYTKEEWDAIRKAAKK